jgi:hypothetical protein
LGFGNKEGVGQPIINRVYQKIAKKASHQRGRITKSVVNTIIPKFFHCAEYKSTQDYTSDGVTITECMKLKPNKLIKPGLVGHKE